MRSDQNLSSSIFRKTNNHQIIEAAIGGKTVSFGSLSNGFSVQVVG
jgi:hypothetical protein